MICGISIMSLLAVLVTALGAYVIAYHVYVGIAKKEREDAEWKKSQVAIETVTEAFGQIYSELSDPKTRQAEGQKISGDIYTVLKAAGIPLAAQFAPPANQ